MAQYLLSLYITEEKSSSSSSSSSSSDEDEIKIRQRKYLMAVNVVDALRFYFVTGGKKPFYRRPGVWLDAKDGKVPLRAVIGGTDSSGEKIYIGRGKMEGALLPGKIVPSHKCCYVSWNGVEHALSKYQVGTLLQPSINFNLPILTERCWLRINAVI